MEYIRERHDNCTMSHCWKVLCDRCLRTGDTTEISSLSTDIIRVAAASRWVGVETRQENIIPHYNIPTDTLLILQRIPLVEYVTAENPPLYCLRAPLDFRWDHGDESPDVIRVIVAIEYTYNPTENHAWMPDPPCAQLERLLKAHRHPLRRLHVGKMSGGKAAECVLL